jgi:20S proteasome, alpha and beta subunits
MTLILAIPTKAGIVLASDGQLTSGEVRASGHKLYSLNIQCAWGASGELALIQRVHESIGGVSVDQPLDQLRDQLTNTIKQCVTSLLQLDFRTQFFQGNSQALLSLHPGDFVFAECRQQPRILHVTSYGTPEWIDRAFATGNGANFAYALLQKYHGRAVNMEQASLLAFKVIEEAIEVGAYGLGPPIELWHVSPNGLQTLEEGKIAALKDTAGQLRESEIDLLLGDLDSEDTGSSGVPVEEGEERQV